VAVDSSIRLRVDGSSAVRELNRVNKTTNVLQSSVAKLGVRLAQVEVARRYFKGFAEADKAAAAVRTLGVNSEKLQRQLLAVSNETKGLVSQTQLLEASYDVASAGFNDAASAANILKAATLGAVGGLSDLNTVADATTSVLNAYGLSSDKASKIVDGFIQTQNDGKIVVAQYAQQIGRVAPIAAAAGVGIEDLNAAISAVTATGVPVESTFAGLRQAIAGVIKPTEEARKTSELLGLEFSSAAIKTKGFGGFLADVIEKTGGSEVALTKLFGSVEAVAAIMPLANDGLEKFNTSLENQRNSAGAAEKATEDLGGTVTAQVSSIINNIGNVARSLDTVLGPAIKDIVTGVNNIISAVSTAISKFQDLATGALSRSAAALQFAASTGTTSESAFTSLKEAIGTLRPELAQSETDLLKLEGALDEAGRAALRFSGKGDFGRLRNEVLDTITAMRQLIINRREALAEQGAGSPTPTGPDPAIAALQQRINNLLEQLNQKGTSSASTVDELARQVEGAADLTTQLERQIALTNEISDSEDRRLQLGYDIADLQKQFPDLKDEEREKLEDLIRKLYEAREGELARAEAADQAREAAEAARKAQEEDPLFQMQKRLEELLDVQNQVAAGATAIGNAFANSFKGVITGSKTAQEALADMMASVAEHFLDMAAQIIAQQIAMIIYGTIMKALNITTPGGGGAQMSNTQYFNPTTGLGVAGPNFGLAEGGYVSGPTNALVGEGGEPEYVIPESKMRESMARYSRGARGSAVIPENGAGGTNGEGGGAAVAAPIDVRYTVERINSVDYVTADQFQTGMRQAADQGAKQGEQRALLTLRQNTSQRRRIGI
jgi:TP901 family phage tail tape measure protein